MDTLIKEYQLALRRVNELRQQISETSDGFIYLTKLRCYGSISWQTHVNAFMAQELCDEYYGDNGIVDVYTNNPNSTLQSYGDVNVLSTEEISNIEKDEISMGQAVTNWIARR